MSFQFKLHKHTLSDFLFLHFKVSKINTLSQLYCFILNQSRFKLYKPMGRKLGTMYFQYKYLERNEKKIRLLTKVHLLHMKMLNSIFLMGEIIYCL